MGNNFIVTILYRANNMHLKKIHMGMLNNIGEQIFLQLIHGIGQDQRCLRNGEYEMANADKLRLEQHQPQGDGAFEGI
uniref:Uncharacterized protein n=1 Tax=Tanacetum cinerariifolium TaxID=118510 RepID=A0A699H7D7_TANCI|nr:hypothetical protein [Tanacetum cinerariifolium]